MSGIIWLASYPKSGNTWMRTFLSKFIKKHEHDLQLNDLSIPLAASRDLIDNCLSLETSELSIADTENLRPAAMRSLFKDISSFPFFMKVHDACTYTQSGEPLFPADISKGVIYIVRNPLDVAVSFAHHSSTSIDKTIERMRNKKFTFCGNSDQIYVQVLQKLQSWSEHVKSWIDQKQIPILLIKYEDMKATPHKTFSEILDFSGILYTEAQLDEAVSVTDFSNLRKLEQEQGFKEKPVRAAVFFRKGESGGWRSELTDAQAQQIINDHFEVMTELGYLDKNGSPVY